MKSAPSRPLPRAPKRRAEIAHRARDDRPPRERPGPVGGPRDSNRRERIRSLLAAALELFLAEGIERVTIDQIAERAEMAKGGFYRYFEDKEDLVVSLFEPLSFAIARAADTCERALADAEKPDELVPVYERFARELSLVFLAHKDEVLLYLQESRAPGVGPRRPIRALAVELAARAIALTRAAHTHELLKPFPPEVTALAVVGAVERLLFGLLSGEKLGDPLEVTRTLIRVVLDGVRQPPR
jgi:AcrR family transcriptional regulator